MQLSNILLWYLLLPGNFTHHYRFKSSFIVTGHFGDFYGCEESCATNQVTFSCTNEETGVAGCMQITRAAYFCDVDSKEYGNVFNVL